MVASCMPPTGDLLGAHNPGMCPKWESNQRPFGSQAGAQSTEPHQPEKSSNIFKRLNLTILSIGKANLYIMCVSFAQIRCHICAHDVTFVKILFFSTHQNLTDLAEGETNYAYTHTTHSWRLWSLMLTPGLAIGL